MVDLKDNFETGNGSVVETEPTPNQINPEEVEVAPTKSTRSPAFQWYPESWFSSSKVQRMSYTEKGIYTDLLGFAWLENGLPTDVNKIAAMLKLPAKRFARIWTNGPLGECWFERGGRLFNARQERERKKQIEHRKQKQDAAHTRWNRDADAMHVHSEKQPSAMPSISVSVSDSVSTSGNTRDCAEPHSDSSPTVLTFPTIGKGPKSWALTEAQVAEWVAAYPGVDVRGQCQRALTWVKANGPKTAKGMPAFLVRWLNNATDRGPRPVLAATGTEGRGRTGAPPKGKYDGIEEHD